MTRAVILVLDSFGIGATADAVRFGDAGANTLGSLVGVVVAVHLLLPTVGLKNVVGVGAAVDVILALWLISHGAPRMLRWATCLAAGASLCLGVLARFDGLTKAGIPTRIACLYELA